MAPWMDAPEGAEAFLNLASELGVRVVYAWAIPFDPEEFLEELEDPIPEDLRTDLERLREEARAYAGRLERFTAVWIHGGLAHSYTEEAEWAAPLRERKEALQEAIRAIEEARRLEAVEDLERAARRLAEDPAFGEARTYDAQIRIAQRLFPELKRRWAMEDPLGSRRRWEELVQEARAIYEAEVRPARERALAEEARRLLAAGMKKTEAAARLGVTRERLDRLLGRYAGEEGGG